MMEQVVLEVNNVSKMYRLGEVGIKTMGEDISSFMYRIRGKENPYKLIVGENKREEGGDGYVWALNEVSFNVKHGEVVGIIGKNGAGKSTLLKLLSRVTAPTTGNIKIKGKLSSLLEVGTGFHPDLTGRENIYLNGAILGMTKKEIKDKIEDIVNFSGCQKYVDTPVKRYSSGMKVRLGFAVAAHMEPDILVVDEVLAVGDAEFQNKCIGKMQEVAGSGRTVLFVSHNMSSIRNLCERVIVLNQGKVVFDGDVEDGISKYLKLNFDSKVITRCYISEDKDCNSNFVKRVEIANLKDNDFVEYTDDIEFYFTINYPSKNRDVFLGIIVEDSSGNSVTVSSTDEVEKDPIFRVANSENEVVIKAKYPRAILKPGTYYLTFSLREKNQKIFHKVEHALTFTVIDNKTFRGMKDRYRKNSIVSPEILWEYVV